MAKILIVDDEINNLRILRMDLEDVGHEVVEATDGVIAWEVLEKHGDSIKLTWLCS